MFQCKESEIGPPNLPARVKYGNNYSAYSASSKLLPETGDIQHTLLETTSTTGSTVEKQRASLAEDITTREKNVKKGKITKDIKVNSSHRVNIATFSTQMQETFLVNDDGILALGPAAVQDPHFTDQWSMIRYRIGKQPNKHTQVMYSNCCKSL